MMLRLDVRETFHMLRHFFVTALIQSGVNAKAAQTLEGHHSTSFTLDQYVDAVPQQLEEAGDKVASVLLAAGDSKTAAAPKSLADRSSQVIEIFGAPRAILEWVRAHSSNCRRVTRAARSR